MKDLKDCDEQIIEKVLTAATNVHSHLGPGLLESIYELALMMELSEVGINAKRQVEIPVKYRGQDLGIGFRADIIVDDTLLIELKAVEEVNQVHLAQVITYLKLLKLKRGYIINFNKVLLKEGIKRVSL